LRPDVIELTVHINVVDGVNIPTGHDGFDRYSSRQIEEVNHTVCCLAFASDARIFYQDAPVAPHPMVVVK
jgi:hypothetical protein